jgi:mono/diheme cytochrome c family protein
VKAKTLVYVALAVLLGTYGTFNLSHGSEVLQGINTNDAELVAQGNRLYARQCASCHGKNLEGQKPNWFQPFSDGTMPAPPHDGSGPTWLHSENRLFDIIKYGRVRSAQETMQSHMPAFADTLSDREIWAVLSFLKSQRPPAAMR